MLTGVALVAILAMLFVSGTASAASRTYTLDADFDEGDLDGVNHDNPNNDQLQLNEVGTTFPILWIANAGEDTLSKIDTNLNKEIARYRTSFGPAGQPGYIGHLNGPWTGPAPSRTAVDIDGNVYVANRQFQGNRPAEIMKILTEGGIDRNGNGVIDTSEDTNNNGIIDPGEILPLGDTNGNLIVDPDEIQDERVAWIVRIGGSNGLGRSLCIGTDGNLWLGLYNDRQYYKVSSADGSVLGGPFPSGGNFPYGCLIDGDGNLWGASLSNNLFELDTNNPAVTGQHIHTGQDYGIALGNDRVYQAIMGGSPAFVEYNPGTGAFTSLGAINVGAYGIATDGNGDIILGSIGGGVTKFAPDGSVIWSAPAQGGTGEVRGVAVDANSDVWLVHRTSHNISKHRGTDGAALGVFPVGNSPYTYSDAAGFAARNITTPTGTWTVIYDGGAAGTQWGTVSWNDSVPQDAEVGVKIRSADNQADLPLQTYQDVTNGTQFAAMGRYIQIQTRLTANTDDESPIVFDLTVESLNGQVQQTCDVDGDGDIDRGDVRFILMNRNQPSSGPDDPADADGDGQITVRDAKICISQCTNPRCVSDPN
jgi:hypothetical protein